MDELDLLVLAPAQKLQDGPDAQRELGVDLERQRVDWYERLQAGRSAPLCAAINQGERPTTLLGVAP